MEAVIVLLAFVLLAVVVAVIAGPLRASAERVAGGDARGAVDDRVRRAGHRDAADRAELEAAREAKYREIRDAELDFRTGKLSREDYDALDAALRAEALEILDRLEALERDDRPGV